jgi:hypothetical protein
MSSDLQNKMLRWEAKPSEDAWNRIASSLDADEEYVLSQKLSSFVSQPPRHVWEHIEARLETRKPGHFITFYQKHKVAFQYSGAAAALIFAAVLINLFVSKPSVSNELTQQSKMQNLPHLKDKSSAGKEYFGTSTNDEADSQAYTDQNSSEFIAGETDNTTTSHSSKDTYRHEKGRSNHALSSWKQAKDSLVNRYFVHTNNRGEAVRFSSKLYDLFECSEEWTDRECAQQIRLWQQKAATSAIYASADFTGVLEMLKGMQEE